MNFSAAFRYPFRNFAKVLSIVLVMTIAFALFIGLLLTSNDWAQVFDWAYADGSVSHFSNGMIAVTPSLVIGALGVVVVAAVSGFWLSGYSVEVVRAIMDERDILPAVQFSQNLQDGFCLFLASVGYWLLLAALLTVEIFALSLTQFLGPVNGLVFFAAALVTTAALFVMGWAYFVGMARFAIEGDFRASWQLRRNMRIARANWRSGTSLLFFMIALSLIYGVVRGIVDGVFGGISGMIGITVSITIYYIFNLMQHFSTQHLIAQYAMAIGLDDPEKNKVDSI